MNNNKSNKNSRSRKAPNQNKGRRFEKHNYQDAAEEREFKKGERYEKMDAGKIESEASNDPSWYSKNPRMLQDYANFSFFNAVGAPFRLNDVYDPASNITISQLTATVPGLMAIELCPTPGLAVDSQSPVNLAAQNVYSFVRYKNSGAANYDAPDLMMYLLGMDSLYSMWNWMKRIYGLASSYNQTNRYMPKALIQANAVDFDDLMSNLSDFRGYINKAAAQISSFCVPATMTYMVRHSWLYSNVYKDAAQRKSQMYMFVPSIFYTFDETTSEEGGRLVPIPVCMNRDLTNLMKVSDIITLCQSMIDNLQYSEDIGIMSGDILKAYERSGLFTLSPVTEDYLVTPVHSEEVMSQIENLNLMYPNSTDISSMNITQDPNTNWIQYNPTFHGNNLTPRKGVLINMHKDVITPADTMVATRLSLAYKDNGDTTYSFTSVGSEFASRCWIYVFTPGGTSVVNGAVTYTNLQLTRIDIPDTLTFQDGSNANSQLYAERVALLSMFDWHPFFTLQTAADASTTSGILINVLGDLDMYSIQSMTKLDSLHDVAVLSEFDVPDGSNF